ncbi:alpha/beta hydrolase [Pseudonocardia aurantiaca]
MLLAGLAAASACAGPPDSPSSVTAAAVTAQAVAWQPCFDGLECGSVTVPADWRRPDDAERITIGLGRLPAQDRARRIGTLLVNPGGPNPVLFGLPRLAVQLAELRQWFDVVVFDPRGMGESSGVTCSTDPPGPLVAAPPDRAAFAQYVAAQQRFARDCALALGALAGTLDAWQVAHDMDAVRAAMGEERLDYFGNSYGTVYGQAYAELFPGNVRRMYLDSVADHTTADLYEMVAPKAEALEANLHGFAGWCGREPSCALHGQDALAVWDRVVAAAERAPIPAPGAGTSVDAPGLLGSVAARVRRERAWPELATALAAADRGDATAFAPTPPPSTPDVPGGALMGLATCADLLESIDHDRVERLAEQLRAVAPRLGWTEPWNFQARCAGLPTGTFPPRPISAPGLPPVLVVNGDDDSATPPEFGRRLVDQLPGARYLDADGGHAVYLTGNPCVREHAHHYLVTGELPPPEVTCAASGS